MALLEAPKGKEPLSHCCKRRMEAKEIRLANHLLWPKAVFPPLLLSKESAKSCHLSRKLQCLPPFSQADVSGTDAVWLIQEAQVLEAVAVAVWLVWKNSNR